MTTIWRQLLMYSRCKRDLDQDSTILQFRCDEVTDFHCISRMVSPPICLDYTITPWPSGKSTYCVFLSSRFKEMGLWSSSMYPALRNVTTSFHTTHANPRKTTMAVPTLTHAAF